MSAIGTRLRVRNALSSGAAALFALLSIALWIGGTENFWSLALPMLLPFSTVSVFAAILGACLKSARLCWSFLAGAVSGLACGVAMALFAVSAI